MLFYRLFDFPKVNFGPPSTFAPWKGWRGIWKIYFPTKNGFSVKNLFWAILGPKMMDSLNSGCNIGIRANVHLCKFVSSWQGYQEYSRHLFYIYWKASWKNVITFWIHITWSCVYIYWLLLLCHVITFPVVAMHLFSWTCNFFNVIWNWVKVKFKRIK